MPGHGWSGSTFVGYGLGNFVWRTSRGPVDAWRGVLTVRVDAVAAQAGLERAQLDAAQPCSRLSPSPG
ncbi:hypothetical protein V3N99_22000 [Dermatophilaceae bacterium Soc4.6]